MTGPTTDGGARTCPVCRAAATWWADAHDVEYRTSADTFHYCRCERCRAVFIDPVPSDRLATIYPPNYYSYRTGRPSLADRVKERLDKRWAKRLLADLPGQRLRVLDVGGGTGDLLGRVRSLDQRVAYTEVVDLDEGAREAAERAGHVYTCSRIEDFRSREPFDLVILLNLIEHVSDPGAVLQSLGELLTPHGIALIKTPNTDSLDARLFRHRDWGGYHCPRHWVLFDRENLTELVGRSGLRVRSFSYTQGAPFWTVAALALLSRLRLVRVTPERPMVQHPLFPFLMAMFGGFDLGRAALGGRPSQMFLEVQRA